MANNHEAIQDQYEVDEDNPFAIYPEYDIFHDFRVCIDCRNLNRPLIDENNNVDYDLLNSLPIVLVSQTPDHYRNLNLPH